ncbi:acylphosphatase [Asanoa sp. WMMD1127]|uniref:acylphosphatase n=1 Tax=Asanoa sp. WMMD1127 TaxID=3016107 RepID=UPI0024171F56|nr:acylphosphatase [Asanoa sp. WMMD1127]MDG4821454.1 acylphosphatase [Asanoa sp. WMMD1127]
MIRRRVVVSGRVQGVFFRDSCRREALAAGVTGWVRNLPDGTVEAAFEGAPEAVERMVKWTRNGPPDAVVYDTTVSDEPLAGDDAFTVRPTPH